MENSSDQCISSTEHQTWPSNRLAAGCGTEGFQGRCTQTPAQRECSATSTSGREVDVVRVHVSERIVRSREVEKPDFSQGRRHIDMRSHAPGSSRRSDRKRSQKATAHSKSGQESVCRQPIAERYCGSKSAATVPFENSGPASTSTWQRCPHCVAVNVPRSCITADTADTPPQSARRARGTRPRRRDGVRPAWDRCRSGVCCAPPPHPRGNMLGSQRRTRRAPHRAKHTEEITPLDQHGKGTRLSSAASSPV